MNCSVLAISAGSEVICGSQHSLRNASHRLIFSPIYSQQIFSVALIESQRMEDSKTKNDVFIVNLLFCKDINVKAELNGTEDHSQEPQSINLQRVSIALVGQRCASS